MLGRLAILAALVLPFGCSATSAAIRDVPAPRVAPAPPPPTPIAAEARALAKLEAVCWDFVVESSRGPNGEPRVSVHAWFDDARERSGSDSILVSSSGFVAAVDEAARTIDRRFGRAPAPPTPRGGSSPYHDLESRCYEVRVEFHRAPDGARTYTVLARYDATERHVSRGAYVTGPTFDAATRAALSAIDTTAR